MKRRLFRCLLAAASGVSVTAIAAGIAIAIAIAIDAHRTECEAACMRSLPAGAQAVALVLGMGPTPSSPIQDRAELAAALYKMSVVGRIVASGGKGPDEIESEAKTLRKILESKGVPSQAIQEEDQSTSTIENLKKCLELLTRQGVSNEKIYIVTHAYHAYRAGKIALALGIRATVLSTSGPHLDHRVRRWLRECLSVLRWWTLALLPSNRFPGSRASSLENYSAFSETGSVDSSMRTADFR